MTKEDITIIEVPSETPEWLRQWQLDKTILDTTVLTAEERRFIALAHRGKPPIYVPFNEYENFLEDNVGMVTLRAVIDGKISSAGAQIWLDDGKLVKSDLPFEYIDHVLKGLNEAYNAAAELTP